MGILPYDILSGGRKSMGGVPCDTGIELQHGF